MQEPTLNVFVYIWRLFLNRRYIPLLSGKFVREFTQQTILGSWWLVFRATLPTLGLIVVLGNFEELKSPGLPYGVHVIGGMVLWAMLPIGLRRGIRCFSHNRRLLMQHQFPRLLVALASMAVPMVYLAIFLVFAIGVVLFYWAVDGVLYVRLTVNLLLAPVILLLVLFLISGISAILGLVFLMARDVRFAVPAFSQLWFLFTPIIYPLSILPDPWPTVVLYANPMAGLIEAFRWSVFGVETALSPYFFVAAAAALVVFGLAIWLVMRSEILLEDLY